MGAKPVIEISGAGPAGFAAAMAARAAGQQAFVVGFHIRRRTRFSQIQLIAGQRHFERADYRLGNFILQGKGLSFFCVTRFTIDISQIGERTNINNSF